MLRTALAIAPGGVGLVFWGWCLFVFVFGGVGLGGFLEGFLVVACWTFGVGLMDFWWCFDVFWKLLIDFWCFEVFWGVF